MARKPTSINTIGIQEIHKFLGLHHKLGADHFSPEMLNAWAAKAEFQLGEGNPPTIEIKSNESVSGHAEEFTVSEFGCNFSEVWKAWVDGKRDEAVEFLVPEGATFDVAAAGADALGVDVSESLNVQRV